MFILRRFSLLALLLALFAPAALADAPALRGYTQDRSLPYAQRYQYVTFGTYPTEADGTAAPVLWRVLGPGTPGEDDVINASNAPKRTDPKVPNGDDFTQDMQDVYCLMAESILDMVFYHDVRDMVGGPGLDYVDTMMYRELNGPVLDRLLTDAEQTALVPMPQRGLLGLPTRKGELFRADYGFVSEDFTPSVTRQAQGTPYAYAQGLKRIKGNSWYFTADWRRYGARWIVGDNGHISVSGVDRFGGIRPVCYVHADKLTVLGGSGTMDDPLLLTVAE